MDVFPSNLGGSATNGQQMTDLPRHSVSVTGIVLRDDGRVLAIERMTTAAGSHPAVSSNSTRPPRTAWPARSTKKPA